MKGLRGTSGGIRLLPGSFRSERAGLLKTGIISLIFHIAFFAFLGFSLGSGGGSSIYRFTIRPFPRSGNGIPESGPVAGSPAAKRPTMAKAHRQTAEDRSRQRDRQRAQEISSIQPAAVKIPWERLKQPPQHQEVGETPSEITIAEVAALDRDANLKKEDGLVAISAPAHPGEQVKGSSAEAGGGQGVKGLGQGSGQGGSGIGLGEGGQGGFGCGWSASSPRYAQNSKPVYPPEARAKGYQGKVLLRVEVLPDGQVGQIAVKKTSGYEALDQSALAAVKQWRFNPARKEEVAVTVWVIIPIKFQLL